MYYPSLSALGYSFFNWDGFDPPTFVGLCDGLPIDRMIDRRGYLQCAPHDTLSNIHCQPELRGGDVRAAPQAERA
jgi:hypothetical protein